MFAITQFIILCLPVCCLKPRRLKYTTICIFYRLFCMGVWHALGEDHSLRVQNRMRRRIFISKRGRVTEGWRKPWNEDLYTSFSSTDIIRMIKSRIMRWAGHVARIGGGEDEKLKYFCWKAWRKIPVGKPADERVVLKLILGKWGLVVRIEFVYPSIWTVTGSCEHGNKHSVSIKCKEFLD